MIDTYKFSTLEYKRPDLEARRAKLAEWKNAAVHAESYAALRDLNAIIRDDMMKKEYLTITVGAPPQGRTRPPTCANGRTRSPTAGSSPGRKSPS